MDQKISRMEEMDYLRGFAILAVIALHTSANYTQIQNVNLLLIINVIIDVFTHFAVPSFIFISGFVLALNYDGLFSKKSFYEKRAKSILPQYIIFSIFYILLNMVLSSMNGKANPVPISTIIFDLLIAKSSFHLWYVPLIFQFYILYPYIIKIYDKFADNNRTLHFIGIILMIQQIWIVASDIAQTILDSTTYLYFEDLFNSWLSLICLSHIFYFVLGIYIFKNYKEVKDQIIKAKKWVVPTILVMTGIVSLLLIKGSIIYGDYSKIPHSYFMVLSLIESIYFPLIYLIILNISLNLSTLKNKYSNIILSLGKCSFGIYLIHAFYMDIIVLIVYPHFGINGSQLIFYPALFISTALLSYISVNLIAHLPYSEIIIGINSHSING